ncbi:MAG: penicillin-binding protein 1A [Hydrogenophilaceae bacterium]|jgi:penicillin-binding protein 1A|nr:penicillin-binding protein 1A [Hydrogenophilaceae bacterium]
MNERDYEERDYRDRRGDYGDYDQPERSRFPIRKVAIGAAVGLGALIIVTIGYLFVAVQGIPGILPGLPDYEALREYEPPVTTRVHAGDGALVAEFAEEHRLFVPIEAIPERVRNAFVSAEDARFFEHSGIDFWGVLRAMGANVGNVLRGRRLQGASTITQQVAGNMLTGRASNCNDERGFGRLVCAIHTKTREGLAAQRIEKALDKERILELYLNEIYLGNRAYGVAAAALNYFDKPLDELTIGEAAFLAVLPKGPANYDPRDPEKRERAIARRDYVIGRMQENGYISAEEAAAARAEPLRVVDRLSGETYIAASHFVEEVRRQAIAEYGERDLYGQGLSIRSTIDTRLQLAAARALRRGIEAYDRRHAWRGPVSQDGDPRGDVRAQLRQAPPPPAMTGWHRAMVTSVQGGVVRFTTEQGANGRLSGGDAQWAASGARNNRDRALRAGSIIYVMPGQGSSFALKQVPEIQGALVAMDPHTGRVLAMIGGYDVAREGYNRATQAMRQPGSAFKPIVYAAALDTRELTPATLIDDSPLAIEAGDGSVWSPENYTREFYGPTTLRRGLEQSRNAMTARVAYTMGIERVVEYGRRLGVFDQNVQPVFALALGSGETSVLRLTTAYAMFVNGGRRVTPIFIDRVQDREGRTIYHADQRACEACRAVWRRQQPPELPDTRAQVLDPITAYQIVSMTEGVVQRGTATAIASLNRPLGGKTGTTNDYRDAWFVGYSPDLAVGVWVGFDTPRNMGEGETGGRIAAPIFRDFMAEALRGAPAAPFRIPAGVRLVRIDAMTGLLPSGSTEATITEAFRPDTEPTQQNVSSPFVFGGSEPIDPRLFQGVSITPGEGARPPQGAQQAPQRQGDLDGLY